MSIKGSQPRRVRLLRIDPGLGWRIRRFLGSPGNVVGTVLAIVGIVMLDAGLVHGLLAAAVIVGLYLTGYFLASRPGIASDLGPAHAKDAVPIKSGLDQMLAQIRKRVAPDIYEVCVSIRDASVYTLDHAAGMDIDPDIHAVRQIALTYLPEAVSRYIALPRSYAEQQVLQDGRTPHDILLGQLRVMERKSHAVAQQMIDRESQGLVTHGRFIDDRLGSSTLDANPAPETRDAVKANAGSPAKGLPAPQPYWNRGDNVFDWLAHYGPIFVKTHHSMREQRRRSRSTNTLEPRRPR